jgi:signal transduction histidine kinase
MTTLGSRLALWYSLISTVTLFGLLAGGYYLLNRHLVGGLDLLNTAEFGRIKSGYGSDFESLTPAQAEERLRTRPAPDSPLFFVEIRRHGGEVLFRSRNLLSRNLPDGGMATFTGEVPELGRLRIGRFSFGATEVWVATPLAQVDQVMGGYAQVSLALVCFILLASLVTGLILSQAALRPVRLIRETANRIRSDNLSERIPVSDVQDEISDLAHLLNEMFDRLESAFQQVRRFSADASHELKTPLSLIRLQAEKLMLDGGLTAVQEDALQELLEEVGHLNRIIEDLLFLSKADAQAIAPDWRRQDPVPFLQAFAQDARTLAEDSNVRFEDRIEGREWVNFDPKWLRQVLLNLLSNALSVSPRGSLVTLESDFTIDAWRLAVEDEGPGVPPEQRARIFDRFVRLAPDSPQKPGAGLGLAICRSIIAMHDGVIRAEAGPRKSGLRVVCELPIHRPDRAASEPAPVEVVTHEHVD